MNRPEILSLMTSDTVVVTRRDGTTTLCPLLELRVSLEREKWYTSLLSNIDLNQARWTNRATRAVVKCAMLHLGYQAIPRSIGSNKSAAKKFYDAQFA